MSSPNFKTLQRFNSIRNKVSPGLPYTLLSMQKLIMPCLGLLLLLLKETALDAAVAAVAAAVVMAVAARTTAPLLLALLDVVDVVVVVVVLVVCVVDGVLVDVVPPISFLRFSILLCDHRQIKGMVVVASASPTISSFATHRDLWWPTDRTTPCLGVVAVLDFCGGGGTEAGNSRPPCGINWGVGW